eukprot:130277-Pelagomonas_calceolata.AAC.1
MTDVITDRKCKAPGVPAWHSTPLFYHSLLAMQQAPGTPTWHSMLLFCSSMTCVITDRTCKAPGVPAWHSTSLLYHSLLAMQQVPGTPTWHSILLFCVSVTRSEQPLSFLCVALASAFGCVEVPQHLNAFRLVLAMLRWSCGPSTPKCLHTRAGQGQLPILIQSGSQELLDFLHRHSKGGSMPTR